MTARPLVSVVIPTRDSGRFLAETLASVAAQTFADHEILVIDAGSTDATLQIAARHAKARVVPQRSSGLSAAWNEGIAAARGELVAFLDSDDLWHPRKLELQAAHLAEHPGVELVATHMRFFLSPGEVLPPAFRRPGLLDADHASLFPGNILVRARLFGVVGVFDPALAIAGDMDWFARIQDLKVATFILPETLYFKRLHAGNLSHGAVAREVWTRELAATVRTSILRRRKREPATTATPVDRMSSPPPNDLAAPRPTDVSQSATGADRYLAWLDSCLAATGADVPALTGSAEAAAARYVGDGQGIGAFGDEGLVSEAAGRSGGLIGLQQLSHADRSLAPGWRGIALCFPRESRLADDFAWARDVVQAGGHLVMFGRACIREAAEAAGVRPHDFVTSHAAAHGGLLAGSHGNWIVPTEHTADIVALWAWIGEFVASCTRLGRMPVMYQSYGVPGARQRPERFRGLKFHAERPVPMEAGQAARPYLSELAATVDRFRRAEREKVRSAAALAVEAKRRGRRLYAFPHNHTLPFGHIGGPHDPGFFKQLNQDMFRVKPLLPVDRGDLVLCVGYGQIYAGHAFGGFAEAMRARGVRLIWSLASYDSDPVCGTAGIRDDEIFVDQHWDYGDAVVECPGYDVRILPTSGVLAEAVMWSVVADMAATLDDT